MTWLSWASPRAPAQTKMPQLALRCGQSTIFAQRLGPTHLAEQDGDESGLCLQAAASKPVRETSRNICEKMLHTLFKAESSSECLSLGKFAPSDRRLSLIFTGSGQQR